jgi:Mn-dependent DtxR family transcriptional regulator
MRESERFLLCIRDHGPITETDFALRMQLRPAPAAAMLLIQEIAGRIRKVGKDRYELTDLGRRILVKSYGHPEPPAKPGPLWPD